MASVFFFQNFEWPISKRLENDDVLIVQLLSHQRHQCDKTLGYYTLQMDRVVVEEHVHLVDSFSDINDRALPVSLKCLHLNNQLHNIPMWIHYNYRKKFRFWSYSFPVFLNTIFTTVWQFSHKRVVGYELYDVAQIPFYFLSKFKSYKVVKNRTKF